MEILIDKGRSHVTQIAVEAADRFMLSDADREDLIPSGKRSRVLDRVLWTGTYLFAARLVDRPAPGTYEITVRGREFLQKAPQVIKPELLEVFPEYVEFKTRSRQGKSATNKPEISNVLKPSTASPEETIALAHTEVNSKLAEELLDKIKGMPPAFFEHLIVQLMLRLGYGGSVEDAGRTLGRSGDGGVDGVIKQDKLGLDNIYLQAKRWSDGTVGRREIQAFVGALAGQGASKGVFITTSTFTKEALEYAKTIAYKVSLVDGVQLAGLMIESDLGVSLVQRYDVKRMDSDFFSEL